MKKGIRRILPFSVEKDALVCMSKIPNLIILQPLIMCIEYKNVHVYNMYWYSLLWWLIFTENMKREAKIAALDIHTTAPGNSDNKNRWTYPAKKDTSREAKIAAPDFYMSCRCLWISEWGFRWSGFSSLGMQEFMSYVVTICVLFALYLQLHFMNDWSVSGHFSTQTKIFGLFFSG